MAAIMAVKMAAKIKKIEYFDTYIPQTNAFGGYNQMCWAREVVDTISQLIGPFLYFEIQNGRHNDCQNDRQNKTFPIF
jgi:hypothetical protein